MALEARGSFNLSSMLEEIPEKEVEEIGEVMSVVIVPVTGSENSRTILSIFSLPKGLSLSARKKRK